jgi:hypothetical protein
LSREGKTLYRRKFLARILSYDALVGKTLQNFNDKVVTSETEKALEGYY